MRLAVCLKVVDRRPVVDPLTGAVTDDERSIGMSDADAAALELALQAGTAWSAEVLAVTAGPPAAEVVLRDALAAGATAATRVAVEAGAPSHIVAAALAPVLADCIFTWCGDHSLDRGSGSVPAYLAAHLRAAQALGLLAVELEPGEPMVVVTRRLDRGRRERLRVVAPAVVSVEASVARLLRAPLTAALAARSASVTVVPGPGQAAAGEPSGGGPPTVRTVRPYRPRARTLAAPAGASALDRIVALTAAHGAPAKASVVELPPPEAAERILAALAAWGYLDAPEP